MVQAQSGQSATWKPVNGEREPVAPSKPLVPSTGSIPRVPQPIDGDEGEVIAPVEQPLPDELMPMAGSNPWTPATGTASAERPDAIRNLGDSAVRSASLSASGAPTPLGGVPQVKPSDSRTGATATRPRWTTASGAAHTAPYTSRAPGDDDPETPASPVTPASAPSTDSAPTPDHADDGTDTPPAHDFGDTGPAYAPPVMAGSADAPTAAGAGGEGGPGETKEGSDDGGKPTPWYAGAPFLIVIGLIVFAGLGYLAYQQFFAPEDVELTPEVLVEAPAEATVDPITLEDPTDFLAAMPPLVGTYAMTAATPVEPDEADLTVTPAEVNVVTYSDGSQEFTLRAIQHFTEEDATEQYDVLSQGGTDPQPVTVGDTEVGQRVTLAEGAEGIYVWRNGTAVFELTGPGDQIEEFYTNFPL